MKRSLTISAVGHAAVLLWCVVSFAAKPYDAGPQDSLPVDIISSTEFSQITAGSRNAPRTEQPKPLAEKIAEPTLPPEDPTLKVSDKPEVKTAAAEAPSPPPPVKPEPKKEAPEQKQPDAKFEPTAEALKKEQKKPPEKKVESKPPPAPKKPVQEQPRFDPIKTAALLLDKREPQRHAVAGDTLSPTPALGLPRANAVALSQNEKDALRAQIEACFSMPAGAVDAKDLTVDVRMTLNQDGSLASAPVVTNRGSGLFQIVAESVMRAIRRCAPYKLPIAKYEAWKDVDVSFDPSDMRG